MRWFAGPLIGIGVFIVGVVIRAVLFGHRTSLDLLIMVPVIMLATATIAGVVKYWSRKGR